MMSLQLKKVLVCAALFLCSVMTICLFVCVHKLDCKKGQEITVIGYICMEICTMINGHTPRELAHSKAYHCNITIILTSFSLVKEEQHQMNPTIYKEVDYRLASFEPFPVSAFCEVKEVSQALRTVVLIYKYVCILITSIFLHSNTFVQPQIIH